MKQKTRRAALKRIMVTKRGKILRRRTRQDHFNARESGKQTRRKRKDLPISRRDWRALRQAIPYLK
jgi:ribosomal protein L35